MSLRLQVFPQTLLALEFERVPIFASLLITMANKMIPPTA